MGKEVTIDGIVGRRGKILGQVIDILPNSIIVETGNEVKIIRTEYVIPLFSIGDEVWIKDTNKRFVIENFAFGREDNPHWRASRHEHGCDGFHSNDTQIWFNVENLEGVLQTN